MERSRLMPFGSQPSNAGFSWNPNTQVISNPMQHSSQIPHNATYLQLGQPQEQTHYNATYLGSMTSSQIQSLTQGQSTYPQPSALSQHQSHVQLPQPFLPAPPNFGSTDHGNNYGRSASAMAPTASVGGSSQMTTTTTRRAASSIEIDAEEIAPPSDGFYTDPSQAGRQKKKARMGGVATRNRRGKFTPAAASTRAGLDKQSERARTRSEHAVQEAGTSGSTVPVQERNTGNESALLKEVHKKTEALTRCCDTLLKKQVPLKDFADVKKEIMQLKQSLHDNMEGLKQTTLEQFTIEKKSLLDQLGERISALEFSVQQTNIRVGEILNQRLEGFKGEFLTEIRDMMQQIGSTTFRNHGEIRSVGVNTTPSSETEPVPAAPEKSSFVPEAGYEEADSDSEYSSLPTYHPQVPCNPASRNWLPPKKQIASLDDF